MEVIMILISIALILFFGLFSEFLFKKTNIPDTLFLILLGFAIGPFGMNYVTPTDIASFAPIFTTFALLFLVYYGAFNIDLASIVHGVGTSLKLTFFNFFLSVTIISIVMLAFGQSLANSILTGFIAGGMNSAIFQPLFQQLKVTPKANFILSFEDAFNDVLGIVGAFAIMELIQLQVFSFQTVIGQIATLFAIAGFIGVIAGIFWMFFATHVLKEHKSYMITIAYVIFIYGITELLQGNGAIAVLVLGLILRNSKELTIIFRWVSKGTQNPDTKEGVHVINHEERFFYSQISFFLKTFFFVYIGVLFSFNEPIILIIGGIIAILLMFSRMAGKFILKDEGLDNYEMSIINAMYAKGLAAATIAQIVVLQGIPGADIIAKVTYTVVSFSIVITSIRLFFIKRKTPTLPATKQTAATKTNE